MEIGRQHPSLYGRDCTTSVSRGDICYKMVFTLTLLAFYKRTIQHISTFKFCTELNYLCVIQRSLTIFQGRFRFGTICWLDSLIKKEFFFRIFMLEKTSAFTLRSVNQTNSAVKLKKLNISWFFAHKVKRHHSFE